MLLVSMGNASGQGNPEKTVIGPCRCGPKLDRGIAVEHIRLTFVTLWSSIAEIIGDNRGINQGG